MVLRKNLFLSLVLVILGGMLLQAQESQDYIARDEDGRTELMNYVIWQEAEIAIIKSDISRLWHTCYERTEVRFLKDFPAATVDQKRKTCTDSDIQALKNRKKDLVQCIEKTLSGIVDLIIAGAQLDVCDNSGKTVLNYCETYEIYELLMFHGAPFQYATFVYFNPQTITVASFGLVVLALKLYEHGYFAYSNQTVQPTLHKDSVIGTTGVSTISHPVLKEDWQDMYNNGQDIFDFFSLGWGN